ncbi:MAG: hypothetical protein HY335_04670 [Deinococcus sp.]|nr:hypothetical protein [Deinococcus sp.]
MTRGGLARHLSTCVQRQAAIRAADQKGGAAQELYHLQVQDAGRGDYWLHLELNGRATLQALDQYLRVIWLECCGHLSQFSLGGWRGAEIAKPQRAERVFQPGVELTYIYDFGTSSEIVIKVVGERQGRPLSTYPIVLMGRNDPPEASCMQCQQRAAWLCLECRHEWGESGTLCQEHAAAHPHEEYGEPLPLVNSPRVGLCGYEGPAQPPY